MVWIIYGHQKPNDSAGLSRSFLDNYAAEDASALFLSMRIKRLLKFIDITNSIKLCHHHLGVWMAGSLCCRRCCFCCLDACFTAWLSDAWRWQQIFHVASGSSSKQQQQQQQQHQGCCVRWLAAKLAIPKQQRRRRRLSPNAIAQGRRMAGRFRRGRGPGNGHKLNLCEKYF